MPALVLLASLLVPQEPPTAPPRRLAFERQTLSKRFTCEGAAFGDLDGDGDADVVAGPWWYEGPEFTTKHALYPEKQFHPLHYSDNFFAWIRDLDGDGKNDVFCVGFPGEDAFWLRNPGTKDGTWERHVVFHGVDNESPEFVDVTGDGKPELVCQNEDRLGFVQADWSHPKKPWTFVVVLGTGAGPKFTHGLGAGDVNGDGRCDLLTARGWHEQPKDRAASGDWPFHAVEFTTGMGGAQMLVTDVDGDGDSDVVTSYAAHGWGLAWFEQRPDHTFVRHEVLPGTRAPGNVSELHALCLCDLDGDGLQDVVTGKRWWSHGPTHDGNADGANDPALLLGLLLRRDRDGAHYEVTLLDDDSGVGTQVTAGDVDGDGDADVVVGNKKGTFVLRQQKPAKKVGAATPTQPPDLDFESGTLRGWTATGNAFEGQPVRGDTVVVRRPKMRSAHHGEFWIGGYELLGDAPTGTLTSAPFAVTAPYATFLVGGGKDPSTRVEVLDAANDRVLFSAHGADREMMEPVLLDLRPHAGKSLRIRLVDEANGGWGHVNFDAFTFHDTPVRGTLPDSIGGLDPVAATKAMTTLPGLQVDLIAAEPDLQQPVALWIDQRARLWVAEAFSYPTRRDDQDAKDTILVFEDRDHDGSYEHRTVFFDKLNLVSGLACGFGGVWVGAAPHLLFIPDRNDDLVPDGPPEIVLDGFGFEDTHETLNSFTWGPDGWLYGTHGVFTDSRVGKPGTPDAARTTLDCGVWRYQPQRGEFEVFAEGTSNPWGVDFDDRGEAFLACCVIPHLWHMVQGGRFQRQGGSHHDPHPWIEITTIADHLHYVGSTRDHAWWNGRERPVTDPGTDLAGGGHAHCGTLIYKADALGAEFRNTILFHNIHGNRVNQDRLERRGSGYVGHHAPDVVHANDPWFRGVALRQGPSGEVFFIDWYDKLACHRETPELWDRTNGRMYRLSNGAPRGVELAMDRQSDDDLAALQASPNDFLVAHARRILQERGAIAASAHTKLLALLDDANGRVRLRALWTLHVTNGIDAALLEKLTTSRDEDVRAWAVRIAAEQPARFPAVIAALPTMAGAETVPAVRLALASALQRLPVDARRDLAQALLAHGEDEDDHNVPTVLWYGVEPIATVIGADFVRLARDAKLVKVRSLMWRRAALGEATQRDALTALLADTAAPHAEILQAIVAALREEPGMAAPKGWSAVSTSLLANGNEAVRDLAAEVALAFGDVNLAPTFRTRLVDRTVAAPRRIAALDGLVRLHDAATGPLLLQLLHEPPMRRAALNAIGAYDLPETPAAVLAVLDSFDATERELALTTLAARPASARVLLESIVTGGTSAKLLDAASLRRQLQSLGDPAIETLLQRAWGRSVRPGETAAEDIARYKQLLTPTFLAAADPSNGRALFARTCQACHTLYGQGGTLAPDLTGSNRGDLDYLLANIVDPSAEVGRDYQLVTVRLADGRVFGGNIVKDTPAAVTLKTLAGTQVVPRRDLAKDTKESSAISYSIVSLMPPGQLQMLSDTDARDLIGYLMTKQQVPIAASRENLGSFFDGRSLAGWTANPAVWHVENGELVGSTATGLAHNDFARSDLFLADFRLEVDVRLAPDTANSGIQFRSEALPDGEMRGYQADIGAGWWGLLYEENGRGVLQPAAANPVRAGEWNHYEILATGARVQLAINGVRTVDFTDPAGARRGIVAPQVHSGGATEVRFRDFRLELDPQPVLRTVH